MIVDKAAVVPNDPKPAVKEGSIRKYPIAPTLPKRRAELSA